MKFLSTIAAAALAGTAFAAVPAERRDVQTAHFTFHAGPVNYTMAVPADGNVYPTNSNLNVNIIDANDFNAYSGCTFVTNLPVTKVQSIDTKTGEQHIILGPPAVVTGVSCHGFCVPNYSNCYDNNGQNVGPCCNGFCAANKCRPWNGV